MMVQLGQEVILLKLLRQGLRWSRNSNCSFSFWWSSAPGTPAFDTTEEYDGTSWASGNPH
jgi:hypothetical protein